ncbi:MAG: hypothetical protein ABIJ97_01810 [Bacteroidota bacterium]
MKTKILFFTVIYLLLFTTTAVNSQNIAIADDDGYIAESSAMLDVKSTDKGMLVPRLTTAQRIAIAGPATGLLVFDIDMGAFYFFDGTGWSGLLSGNETDPEVGVIASGYSPKWDGSALVTGAIFQDGSGNVGIGTEAPLGKLHINQSDANALFFSRAAHDTYRVGLAGNGGIYFHNITDSRVEMVFLGNGYIGMGTLNPIYPLEIERAGEVTLGLDNTTANRWFFKSDNSGNLDFFNSTGGFSAVLINSTGNVGIGTSAPQGALDVSSTTGGFIVPRMTTTQRNAMTAINGMIIYNTTSNNFNFYENGVWVTK